MSIDDIKHKYEDFLEKFQVFDRGDVINVALISIKPEYRGRGMGRRLFFDLIDYADKTGQIITLTPTNEFGSSKAKLIDFYKSFGFVINKGKNKDFRFTELMYRVPETNKETKKFLECVINDIMSML